MSSSSDRRAAFTLIEILVVIAITALLIGLLLSVGQGYAGFADMVPGARKQNLLPVMTGSCAPSPPFQFQAT